MSKNTSFARGFLCAQAVQSRGETKVLPKAWKYKDRSEFLRQTFGGPQQGYYDSIYADKKELKSA